MFNETKKEPDPETTAKLLIKAATELLAQRCGVAYQDIVLRCLKGDFGVGDFGISDTVNNQVRADLQVAFHERVFSVLEKLTNAMALALGNK